MLEKQLVCYFQLGDVWFFVCIFPIHDANFMNKLTEIPGNKVIKFYSQILSEKDMVTFRSVIGKIHVI